MTKEVEMKASAEHAVVALAAQQNGRFNLRQSKAAGVTRKMLRTRVANGGWGAAEFPHVYAIGGHPSSAASRHSAALLAVDQPSARSSGRAAAWLWGLTPFEQQPEITVTDDVRVRIEGIRVHRTTLVLREPVLRHHVLTTTAAETLLDLGGVVGLDKVRNALDRGIANRVLTPMDALVELERRGGMGVPGTGALRRLLDEAGITGSHPPSVLEAKTRRLITLAGLPQPECELIVGKNGEYRLDFCWPELMLTIEVDGWLYHSSHTAFVQNKTRKNALTIAGHVILEYTWMHVTRTPKTVVAEIRRAHEARSRLLLGREWPLKGHE